MTRAYRLPAHVRPTAYHVDLSSDPDRPDFSGHARIEMRIESRAPVIEMHARDLTLTNATLEIAGKRTPLGVELDADSQVVRFLPLDAVPPGRAAIEVDFKGRLNPGMHGIYLASDGASKAICTQCEATDARGIFPCFDEPEFKASIAWTLRTREGLVALTNGVSAGEEATAEGRVWRFEQTKPVSSYLAAVAIGDFEGSPVRNVGGVPLRVWATKGKVSQTNFAVDYTAKLIPWFEDYFAVPYPYGKYDQVAVPGFDAGAMENIGLVLFRQNLLLMDPALASWRQEKVIAKVIAHEMAHMWFGNLVTMKWWDDLWLNEAFAEWMAHKAVDRISPDYRVWEDFQDDKNAALADDALPVTHPIWTPVELPEQAIEMFDVITYQKGCAVMRMLENFLGEIPFRDGLRSYMQTYAYANAAGGDLWRELERASGRKVGALMKSWIAVPGFPVLSASLQLDGSGKPALQLSQRRFFSDSTRAKQDNEQLWSVPIVARYEDDDGIKEHRFILNERAHLEPLPARGTVRWCYPNAGEIGFYRLRPDSALRETLLRAGLPKLSAVERMGLIEDQWALVRNATATIDGFLAVLEAMTTGSPPAIEDHNVLRASVDRMGAIERLLEDSGDDRALSGFRSWVRGLLGPALKRLGTTPQAGEPQNDVQRRALLIHAVGKIGRDQETLEAALRAAEAERKDARAVDPNLATTFLGIAAMLGDDVRFDRWIETYRARKSSGAPPQTTLRYLYTFAEFRPEPLVNRTIALIEDGTIPQEATSPVLGQLLGLRHSQHATWSYVQRTWEALKKRVGDMGLSRVVEALGSLPHTRRAEIVRFFEEHPPAGAERALSRALERMDEREELRRRVTPPLIQRFTGL